jgi:hypothetical protein
MRVRSSPITRPGGASLLICQTVHTFSRYNNIFAPATDGMHFGFEIWLRGVYRTLLPRIEIGRGFG